MRRCFVCGSDQVCDHREIDLLPPRERRAKERAISQQCTGIPQAELDEIAAIGLPIQHDRVNADILDLHLLKKTVAKAVNGSGKTALPPKCGKLGT